jgi:hypothetical protein
MGGWVCLCINVRISQHTETPFIMTGASCGKAVILSRVSCLSAAPWPSERRTLALSLSAAPWTSERRSLAL